MKTSSAGIAFIKNFERCSLSRYWDVSGWSIGWGHHSDDAPPTCTQEQADEWLENDLVWAEAAVNALDIELTQNQFDALVDFTYNEGAGALRSATFVARLRDGDVHGAMEALLWWDKAGPVVSESLLARRQAERELFLSP